MRMKSRRQRPRLQCLPVPGCPLIGYRCPVTGQLERFPYATDASADIDTADLIAGLGRGLAVVEAFDA